MIYNENPTLATCKFWICTRRVCVACVPVAFDPRSRGSRIENLQGNTLSGIWDRKTSNRVTVTIAGAVGGTSGQRRIKVDGKERSLSLFFARLTTGMYIQRDENPIRFYLETSRVFSPLENDLFAVVIQVLNLYRWRKVWERSLRVESWKSDFRKKKQLHCFVYRVTTIYRSFRWF